MIKGLFYNCGCEDCGGTNIPVGPQGSQGPTGPAGVKGDTGDTGADGAPGYFSISFVGDGNEPFIQVTNPIAYTANGKVGKILIPAGYNTPVSILVNAYTDNITKPFKIRLRDMVSGSIVAENNNGGAGFSSTSDVQIIDMGPIANWNAAATVYILEVEQIGGTDPNVRVSSITFAY